MTQLEENLHQVRTRMAQAAAQAGRCIQDIQLCAASKTQPADVVRAAAALPIDLFGENRVQEMCEKHASAAYGSKPLHFIGHLQTNKVRLVVGRAEIIESVGSAKLLASISAQAQKQGIYQQILLEVNIGGETSKSGVSPEALWTLLEQAQQTPAVRVRGLMSIPPSCSNPAASRPYFARMRTLFEQAKRFSSDNIAMDYLSMGMSADYAEAILEGANIVRVGTALFGARSVPVNG